MTTRKVLFCNPQGKSADMAQFLSSVLVPCFPGLGTQLAAILYALSTSFSLQGRPEPRVAAEKMCTVQLLLLVTMGTSSEHLKPQNPKRKTCRSLKRLVLSSFFFFCYFLVHRLSLASSSWHLYLEKREGVLGYLYLLDNICIYHNINYKAAYLGQAVPRSRAGPKVLFMFWLTVFNCVTRDLPDRWPCFQLNPCILRFCGGC